MIFVRKIWRTWLYMCATTVTAGLIAVAGFYIYLYFKTEGFHPANDPVESCLYQGGTWNAEQEICTRTS